MPLYLKKLIYKLRDLIDYLRAFQKAETSHFRVVGIDGGRQLLAAKRLNAKVYLDRGFVEPADVVDGMLTESADPHQTHSKYFGVIDARTSRMVATAHQIEFKGGLGHDSFAMTVKADLYARGRKLIYKHEPSRTIEVSGLAKERGVSKIAPLFLYRAMWQHSLRKDHTLWLMACDVRLFIRLKLLFGKSITKIGRVTPYYGGDVVPAIMNVQASITNMKKSFEHTPIWSRPLRRRIARFMLSGVPVELLSAKERSSLVALLRDINRPFVAQVLGSGRAKIRFVAIGLSLAYTVVRFLLVGATLSGFGIQPWLFLWIDAVAGVLYVLGIEQLIVALGSHVPWRRHIGWAAVAAVAFSAPYIYLFIGSHKLPPSFVIGLCAVVVLLLASALLGIRRRLRSNHQ